MTGGRFRVVFFFLLVAGCMLFGSCSLHSHLGSLLQEAGDGLTLPSTWSQGGQKRGLREHCKQDTKWREGAPGVVTMGDVKCSFFDNAIGLQCHCTCAEEKKGGNP